MPKMKEIVKQFSFFFLLWTIKKSPLWETKIWDVLWVADVVGVNNRTQHKKSKQSSSCTSNIFFCSWLLIWLQPNSLNLWILSYCEINVAVIKTSQGKTSTKETMKPLIKARAWIKNLVRYIFMALSLHLVFCCLLFLFLLTSSNRKNCQFPSQIFVSH